MSLEPDSTIDGRYRVISALGEGGMGAVYVVEHIAMRKRMALKVLHREMGESAEIRERFEREAIAAAHIDHPNVVAASDFGRTAEGEFFMVLEYVEGRSLRAVSNEGPLEERRAIALLSQMTSALVRAHELGVVHRDLKPENVMIVVKDSAEQVKVLDFGIAKLQGALAEGTAKSGVPLTQLGMVFGTPEYISPEQAQGQTVDARADLYALGVIFFEMLTGRRPFEADEPMRLLLMHTSEPPPAVRALAPQVSEKSAAIVARLLEKSPDARYPDARALAAALDDAIGVASPTPSPVASTSTPGIVTQPPVSGLAPTVVGATAAPVSSPIDGVIAKLPPALRSLPRAALAGIGLALVVAPLLLLVVVISIAGGTHGGTTTNVSASSSAPKPPPTAKGIDDADVAAASASGSAALERLSSKAPSDPRILRALVTAYTHEDKHGPAMATLRKWATVDPTAGKNPDVESAVLAAATASPADLDAALEVLEGPLGSDGVDLMLDLLAKQGVNAATKTKLSQSLAKPAVRAHATPAAALAIDFRAAKSCDARLALMDRVTREGDARLLPMLESMRATSGCGFLSRRDCWACMRKDGTLEAAISAIEARRQKP